MARDGRTPIPRIATRLSALDLTRSTEQVAIVLSPLVGRASLRKGKLGVIPCLPTVGSATQDDPIVIATKALHKKTVLIRAIESLLGHLDDSTCWPNVVDWDESDKKVQWPNMALLFAEPPPDLFAFPQKWKLDLILSPVDGARTLAKGTADGAISAIAGGPAGIFPPDLHDRDEYYFILATAPTITDPNTPFIKGKTNNNVEKELAHVVNDLGVIPSLLNACQEKTHKGQFDCTFGTLGHDSSEEIQQLFIRYARTRSYYGSSVAAALSVYLHPFSHDAFAAVVRRPHAAMIAVASLATGGGFYAFPVKVDQPCSVMVKPNVDVFTSEHFVNKPEENEPPDVFLIATGIVSNPILPGIEFHGRGSVTTYSICLRAATRSARVISHRHNLHSKKLRLLNLTRQDGAVGTDLVTRTYHEFEADLQNMMNNGWREKFGHTK